MLVLATTLQHQTPKNGDNQKLSMQFGLQDFKEITCWITSEQ